MSELDRLYDAIGQLRMVCGGERRLATCDGRMGWPRRGVYFFFEPGEIRRNGEPRIVRVGTHALTARSRTSLWNRLSQHRGTAGGQRPGGGNHRGSIFRLHVGQCLLARDGDPHGVASTWGVRPNASYEIREREAPHERAVSEHIGRMPFLWLDVSDDPGPTSDRAAIEMGVIALLSRRTNPEADAPSSQWLGSWSSRETIRTSGLWNVQHVDIAPTEICQLIERHVDAMSARSGQLIGRRP